MNVVAIYSVKDLLKLNSGDCVTKSDLEKISIYDEIVVQTNKWAEIDSTHVKYLGEIPKEDNFNTAFGEKITTSAKTQIANNFYLGIQKENVNVELTNSGNVSIVGASNFENMLKVSSGVTANSTIEVSDVNAIRYIAGHELYLWASILFNPPTDLTGYIHSGIMDKDNGFWIGFKDYNGEMLFGVAIRKDGADDFVPQSEFNLDKLDGTGLSGFTLDPTKGNIFRIRSGYLGFAPPSFEILLPNGVVHTFHRFNYPNTEAVTHISSTYISPRTEVSNGNTAEEVYIQNGSLSAGTYDSYLLNVTDRNFSLGINGTLIGSSGYNRRPVVLFRNLGEFQGYLSPTVKNHKIPALLKYLSMILDGQNKTVRLELLSVPLADITNTPTYTNVSEDSIVDYTTNATVDFTNAKVNFTTVFTTGGSLGLDKIEPNLENLESRLKPGFAVVFALTSDTPSDINYDLAIAWIEEF